MPVTLYVNVCPSALLPAYVHSAMTYEGFSLKKVKNKKTVVEGVDREGLMLKPFALPKANAQNISFE